MRRFTFHYLLVLLVLSCSDNTGDPCDNVTCLNGGGCNNGKCACPPGYIGDNCGNTMEPSKIRVEKIEVTKFPNTNTNGEAWDSDGGPDLYVTLGLQGGNSYLSTESEKIDNAISSKSYEWYIKIIYQLESVTENFAIELWDYDEGSHPLIGRGIFKPYDPSKGLPNPIIIESSSGTVTFKLFVSYSF